MATQSIESVFYDIIGRARVLDPVNSRNWFGDLSLAYFEGGSIHIACPDKSTLQFLDDNCKESFTRAAQQITGHLVTIEFCINHAPEKKHQTVKASPDLKLHPDYTFANFVVGPSNRLAHASCIAVAQSPGKAYNPLFIYGNSGLGKTHLLQAVCRETERRYSDAVIQFCSCENFVNRFIRSIEKGNPLGFQTQFRDVDSLVIDDIQFLRDREQSQEEFFHTFNAIYNNGKQIILSADSSPSEIPALEERLISRFNWGLVARIDPPSYETRVAIVQKKAHLRGMRVSDKLAEYIAQKLQANIREIEGALTTIHALAMTTGKDITLQLAHNALEEQLESGFARVSFSNIIDAVTKHFNVRLTDLQSKRRSQSVTFPRQICMYLARNLTRHSLEEIGGHLGGRDHTTVMHACSKIENRRKSDAELKAELDELTREISHSC